MKKNAAVPAFWVLVVLLSSFVIASLSFVLGNVATEMDMALTAIRVAHVQCDLPDGSLAYRSHKLHDNGVLEVFVDYNGSDSYSVLFGTLECSLGKG